MDGSRFDYLTKILAAGTSRRRALKDLLGGASGGALSLVGLRRAGASHGRPLGATCMRNEHCASGLCDPATRRCTCLEGTTACGGQCVTTCPAGATPSGSSCQCVCTATGQPPCGTGAATVCCAEGEACVAGACQALAAGTCTAGEDFCTQGSIPSARCGANNTCACLTTPTGAPFCTTGDGVCAACETDADCAAMGHPAGSACVVTGREFCMPCASTGGTACVRPCPV